MKKSELITGIILTLAGAAALAAAFLTETSFDGIFWGIAGAGLCLGIGKAISWFHWSSPAQADKLKELQENKEIAQHDELNRMMMDKAGRIGYIIGLLLIVSVLISSISQSRAKSTVKKDREQKPKKTQSRYLVDPGRKRRPGTGYI